MLSVGPVFYGVTVPEQTHICSGFLLFSILFGWFVFQGQGPPVKLSSISMPPLRNAPLKGADVKYTHTHTSMYTEML